MDDRQNPRFARAYLAMSPQMDARGVVEHRRGLLAGLSGRVVEIGAGNGLNFAHYPPEVTEVVAVEPENLLRAAAERAAVGAPVPVRVVDAHAEALPGEGYDAAVLSLVLCSVSDPARALAEAHRVLRDSGELRFYEHVRSANRGVALVEDLVAPLWAAVSGGCRPNRDPVATAGEAGFTVTDVERFGFRPTPLAPKVAHVLGTAHRN